MRAFAPDEIPWDELAFTTVERALRDWVASLPGRGPRHEPELYVEGDPADGAPRRAAGTPAPSRDAVGDRRDGGDRHASRTPPAPCRASHDAADEAQARMATAGAATRQGGAHGEEAPEEVGERHAEEAAAGLDRGEAEHERELRCAGERRDRQRDRPQRRERITVEQRTESVIASAAHT